MLKKISKIIQQAVKGKVHVSKNSKSMKERQKHAAEEEQSFRMHMNKQTGHGTGVGSKEINRKFSEASKGYGGEIREARSMIEGKRNRADVKAHHAAKKHKIKK